VRGAGSGQPAEMEDGRTAPRLGRRTLQGPDLLVPSQGNGTQACAASVVETATFSSADRARVVAAGPGGAARPIHGLRLDHRGRPCLRPGRYRYRDRQGILRIGPAGDPRSGAATARRAPNDTAQQRFPDLRRRGSGNRPSPNESLESKGSKRPWAIQSHFDHPGWYIVWRYLIDPTESLERGRPAIIWRVDVVFLEKADWKYEGSGASSAGGGRTHTFGVRNPAARLAGKAVYQRSDVVIRRGKPVPANGGDP